ncbi:LysR family transcriptional regulator [Microvirga flavescens]|uniref:LysR family transcriptional regulator n=1 Tax=Microvirga flavescens TaxID=2249811 RepID=UPI001FE20E97|nr:LysR family transcriptional regulator [Microvirga flavescens]
MMLDTLDWEFCRSFLAVMREGSLSAAARSLGLTQPTIGHHIDRLETTLGKPLFTRSQRGLMPTDAARGILPHVEAMSSAAQALVRTASGNAGEMRGAVRITASEVIGVEVLPPILTAFAQSHPEVSIELSLSNRMEDLLRRDADIAIRMARPSQGSLLVRSVGGIGLGFHAHRRYLDARGYPQTFNDLEGHALIGFDQEEVSIDDIRELGTILRRDRFSLRADSHLAQLAAIRAGFGIGICQIGIARREPDLVHLFPEAFRPSMETWIAMHRDLRASRRIHAMFQHLAASMAAYAQGRGDWG